MKDGHNLSCNISQARTADIPTLPNHNGPYFLAPPELLASWLTHELMKPTEQKHQGEGFQYWQKWNKDTYREKMGKKQLYD